MRILHLSDTHLDRAGGVNAFGIDARQNLRLMLADCAEIGPIDLVVVSGDVADDGAVESYAAAAAIVGRYAHDRGLPIVYCMGNHDHRDSFAEVLGSGHIAADGTDTGTAMESSIGERAAVSIVSGHRIIGLDSHVPGEVHGWIGAAQLSWLARILATPSPAGTVLVMHHPPIAPDAPLPQAVMLRNAAALASVIEGADVRMLLCGHFHFQVTGRLGHAAVVVSPGVLTRIDLTSGPRAERVVRGASATVVELGRAGPALSYVVHARDQNAGLVVHEMAGEQLAAAIALFTAAGSHPSPPTG